MGKPEKPVESKATAVVFVHGQGEQTPMDDLLQLAFSVWETDPSAAQGAQLGNIASIPQDPDNIGDLRCLISDRMADGRTFHFYQFYWAHLMAGNQIWDVWAWLLKLLARPAAEIPRDLRVIRLVLLGFVYITVATAFAFAVTPALRLAGPLAGYGGWLTNAYALIWAGAAAILLWLAAQGRRTLTGTIVLGASILAAGALFGANLEDKMPGNERHLKGVTLDQAWVKDLTCVLDSNPKDSATKGFCQFRREHVFCLANPGAVSPLVGGHDCGSPKQVALDTALRETPVGSRPRWDTPISAWSLVAASHRFMLALGGVAYLLFIIMWSRISPFLRNVMADSARYFSNDPRNVATRDQVRVQGVKLLKQLHDSGKFDRIIVVAHSLGTVVAYNMLDHYWGAVREQLAADPKTEKALAKVERRAYQLDEAIESEIPTARAAYRRAQRAYAKVLSEARVDKVSKSDKKGKPPRQIAPWLITDLVTLGSPLTYFKLLAVDSDAEFTAKMSKFYRLPANPPASGADVRGDGDRRRVLHGGWLSRVLGGASAAPLPAAVFAAVRWSNIYFTNNRGGKGDIVGGPVGPNFGRGVVDVEIDRKRLGDGFLHNQYWKWPDQKKASAWAAAGETRAYTPPPHHIARLRQAINLFESDEAELKLMTPDPPPSGPFRR